MDARCGKTFADSLRLFRRYYDRERPLPFLMIVTWNDYEEGTAIERGLSVGGMAPVALEPGAAFSVPGRRQLLVGDRPSGSYAGSVSGLPW